MKKNITPNEAHKKLVAAIGNYGWFPLNDYRELRNIILFGDRHHEFVYNLDEMLPAKVIEDAMKMMNGELIISIRRLVTKKGRVVWGLDILPMGPGFVCGWEYGIMRTGYDSIEDCLNAIETRKNAIVEKAIESKGLYITGDKDAVDEVAKFFDNPICFYN